MLFVIENLNVRKDDTPLAEEASLRENPLSLINSYERGDFLEPLDKPKREIACPTKFCYT